MVEAACDGGQRQWDLQLLEELQVDEALYLGHVAVGQAAPGLFALWGADVRHEVTETIQNRLGDRVCLQAVEQLVSALLNGISLALVGDA